MASASSTLPPSVPARAARRACARRRSGPGPGRGCHRRRAGVLFSGHGGRQGTAPGPPPPRSSCCWCSTTSNPLIAAAGLLAELLQSCPWGQAAGHLAGAAQLARRTGLGSGRRWRTHSETWAAGSGRCYRRSRCVRPIAGLLYYDAVAFFSLQAQRVRADFRLAPATAPHVLRLCQLVEGAPLALELAAGWLRCAFLCRDRGRNRAQPGLPGRDDPHQFPSPPQPAGRLRAVLADALGAGTGRI